MGLVFIEKEDYPNPSDVINLANYIATLSKCPHFICRTSNIISSQNPFLDMYSIARQFICIQDTYKGQFKHRVYHIYYSLDMDLDTMTIQSAESIGIAFMMLYSQYQSIFAVHEDKGFLHFHMMINNISWIDGVKPLSHYISQMNLDSLAYAVLKDYQDYYMIHKMSKIPSATLMAKDAFYRFISGHYSEI